MANQKLPNLIIAGVHKAGTTSVFTWLAQHPEICGSSKKEIGFFMPLHYGKHLPSIENYSRYFENCEDEKKYLLEASPSYLYGGQKIIEAIKFNLKDVKIILVFRNPTERLFSFYERKKANTYLPSDITFKQFVEKSLAMQNLHETSGENDDTLYIRAVKEGYYNFNLIEWINAFDNEHLHLCFFEDLKEDSLSFMKSLSIWLEIDPAFYTSKNLEAENQTTTYDNRILHKIAIKINRTFETFWRKNLELKRLIRKIYNRANKGGNREKLSDDDRKYVDSIYYSHNEQLANTLIQKGYTNLPSWLTCTKNN